MLILALLVYGGRGIAGPDDVLGLFRGASESLPWGSTKPAPFLKKDACEARGALDVCLASDEQVNSRTRSQTQFVYCKSLGLVGVTVFIYGDGARDTIMAMSGSLSTVVGPPQRTGAETVWTRQGATITISPSELPATWTMQAIDSVRMRACASGSPAPSAAQ